MERIKFIVDTSGDISPEDAARLDLHLVPMGIVVDGKFCKDRVDFSPSEFWEILKTCKDAPTSVAVNPQEWFEHLAPYVKSGEYDRLIVTGVGRTVSGTLNSAVLARDMLKEEFPEEMSKIEIVIYDSNMSTIGFGVGVVKAAEMYQSGADFEKINSFLLDWFENVEVLFVAFSFDLPKKSGRINSASAYVGSKLNLRPVMMVKEGKFTTMCKVRGDNKVAAKLLDIATERMREGSDFFSMNGTHPTILPEVTALFEEKFGKKLFSNSEAGPAMTLNGGWDMFCIGFLGKNPVPIENPLGKT